MVSDMPQSLHYPYRDDEGRLQIAAKPIDERICDDFAAVQDGKDYMPFFLDWNIFPSSEEPGADIPTEADFIDVRDVLSLATRLHVLYKECQEGQTPTLDKLLEAGRGCFCVEPVEDGVQNIDFRFELTGRAYTREFVSMTQRNPLDYEDDRTLEEAVSSSLYVASPLRVGMEDGRFYIMPFLSSWAVKDEDIGWYAGVVSHWLFDAHLQGIATTEHEGRAVQTTSRGLSALWLAYLNKMSCSRITICKACGKTVVVKGDRGKPRKYCSNACKEWAHKHPGQTRAMRGRK